MFVPRLIVSPAIEISPFPSLPNKFKTLLLVLPTIGTRPVIFPTSLDMVRTAFPLLELIRLIRLRLLRVPFFLRPPRNFILYIIIRLLFCSVLNISKVYFKLIKNSNKLTYSLFTLRY